MKKWKLPVLLAIVALLVVGATGYGIHTWMKDDDKPQSVATKVDPDQDSNDSSDTNKQDTVNKDEASNNQDSSNSNNSSSSSKKKNESTELPVYKDEKKDNQGSGNKTDSNETKPSQPTPDETNPGETEEPKDDTGVIELPMVPVN